MSGSSQLEKARAFQALHREGLFVMPNAWHAGSAKMLAHAGFPAIATTSAGIAFALGVPDYEGALTREANLAECRRIADAVSLPVSADTENGYGASPEDAAETMRQALAAGLVGASLEDYSGDRDVGLYDIALAAEKVRAAREAIDAQEVPLVLTARAECFLTGHDDPLAESIRRLQAYQEAGADCLYAPGLTTREQVAAVVGSVDKPTNVVMGLVASDLSLDDLRELGVRRVSVGGSLARAAFGGLDAGIREIVAKGTFTYAHHSAMPGRRIIEILKQMS